MCADQQPFSGQLSAGQPSAKFSLLATILRPGPAEVSRPMGPNQSLGPVRLGSVDEELRLENWAVLVPRGFPAELRNSQAGCSRATTTPVLPDCCRRLKCRQTNRRGLLSLFARPPLGSAQSFGYLKQI